MFLLNKYKDHDLAIPAHEMSMESIITKLGWLLAQKHSYEQIKHKMLEDLHGEINIENELIWGVCCPVNVFHNIMS